MKNLISKVFLFVVLFNIPIDSICTEVVHLFIIAGQSNAQGNGQIASYPGVHNDIPFCEPLLYPYSVKWDSMDARNSWGPEVTFADKLKDNGFNPAIFKYAMGATSLAVDWLAPGGGGLYDAFIDSLDKAIVELEKKYIVEIKGFIWVQGESDIDPLSRSLAYKERLLLILNHFRNHLDIPSLPIVIGFNDFHSNMEGSRNVQKAQDSIVSENSYISYLGIGNLELDSGEWHLTANGLEDHGGLLYDNYLVLANTGWFEHQVCPGQWNNARDNSDIQVGSSGNEIFYINSHNQLCALYKSGLIWGDAVISGSNQIAGGNGFLLSEQDYCIYYISSTKKLSKAYFDKDKWYNVELSPNQIYMADNYSLLKQGEYGNFIYYIDSNRYLCALAKNGSSWNNWRLSGNTKVKNGSCFEISYIDACIYYVEYLSDKIYKAHYTGNGLWANELVTANMWNNASPFSELELSNSGKNIYYINASNRLCCLYEYESTWYDAILNYNSKKAIVGTGLHNNKSGNDLYYIGEDAYLYKMYYSITGWKYEKLHQDNDKQTPAKFGIGSHNNRIYYVGDDYKIHSFIKKSSTELNIIDNLVNYDILNENKHQLKIYPNPVASKLTVELPKFELCIVKIIDLQGNEVFSDFTYGKHILIDCSELSNGLYVLRVHTPSKTYKDKIIIGH